MCWQRILRYLLLILLTSVMTPIVAQADTPLVAAASDLQFALQEVAKRFSADTGASVQLVFGSSGNFYRQISQGAPFQLFLSADERYVEQLAAAGKTQGAGALYAIGRLVLIAPQGGALRVDSEFKDLRQALTTGQVKRFAIANPEHAPYGQRAEEALRHAGLWNDLQGKLVLGENVSQAAQFAISGNAQGGIIAYSLALSPQIAGQVQSALIPQDWHQPLRQRMVLLKGASPDSQAFFRYLQEPEARSILHRYGFSLPDDI